MGSIIPSQIQAIYSSPPPPHRVALAEEEVVNPLYSLWEPRPLKLKRECFLKGSRISQSLWNSLSYIERPELYSAVYPSPVYTLQR
jgi:hypothetical protein